jgi:2,3-diaminopropionate biosynthesis protein SbnB
MPESAVPALRVITGAEVMKHVDGNRPGCVAAVRDAYLAHDAGDTVNPHSSFLRFPHRQRDRIIALPAYLGGSADVAGIKWIASFPDNTSHGIPRASATLVLNDTRNGYPYVFLESSIISATRTAASAVLGAEALVGARTARRIGFVGTGLIADHVRMFLRDLDWHIGGYTLFDLNRANAERFAARIDSPDVVIASTVDEAFTNCDLVILATVAGSPHIQDPALLAHNPVVLHLSLRDLDPALILASQNITDDIDHAVRERTSLHLASFLTGDRSFVHGTIGDVLRGQLRRDSTRAAVFAPFGLGVLDLAVGKWVHDSVVATGGGHLIPDFFSGAVG